jgi:hypothetical protein
MSQFLHHRNGQVFQHHAVSVADIFLDVYQIIFAPFSSHLSIEKTNNSRAHKKDFPLPISSICDETAN